MQNHNLQINKANFLIFHIRRTFKYYLMQFLKKVNYNYYHFHKNMTAEEFLINPKRFLLHSFLFYKRKSFLQYGRRIVAALNLCVDGYIDLFNLKIFPYFCLFSSRMDNAQSSKNLTSERSRHLTVVHDQPASKLHYVIL